MHESHHMTSVVWKDKKFVLLHSTHAISIGYLCMLVPIVSRRNGTVREDVMTSSIHLEYTTHMHGVNVVDQLYASYSTQNCTHKWWHTVFFFSLDMTIINMFIIYLAEYKRWSKLPISHLQFKVQLCEALLQNWGSREYEAYAQSRSYCYPASIAAQRPCVVCNRPGMVPVTRTTTYCKGCNNKYMCFKKGYYKQCHDNLH